MIAINDLTYEIGSRALYDEANWHIKPGEKIGLIGANGTGKTTLLRLIVKDYTPSAGSISYAKEVKIGYLNQDMLSIMTENSILHVAMEAFERQNQLHDEIEELLKKLETDHSEDIIHKLSDKQHEFELLDGYNIQYKAEEILAGLGFSTTDTSRPLKEFSGGWRMRVMLAKILLQEPDLLLLDEPTNHLDLPSIKWLETYLGKFSGAFVIVSHDRYFLDRTVTKIVESKGGQLIEYSGNYSFYLDEKAEREELQRNRFKNQQQQIKQEKQLIDRFRAKASKAKMVQSRIKALDRMERVEDVDGDAPIVNFKFSFSKHSGKTLVEMDTISKSYPNIDLLEKTSAMINRGDKIALIGANGKGKSTLLRIATGREKCEGKVTEGYNVTKAFYAQHQLEDLDLNKSILDEMLDFAPTYTEKDIRSLLGCFLFSGDDAFKKIKVLSGGEKSRVALAKTLTMDANFLILDEPTNHLDMQSVNILIQALQQYKGTFILVSHDRYLVQNVANTIWYIENKEIKEYPGSYEEYEYWSEQQKKEEMSAVKNGKVPKSEKAKKSKPSASQNNNKQANSLYTLKQQLSKLEDDIAVNENEQKNIENELAKETVFSVPEKLNETNERYQNVKTKLLGLNKEWEVLADQIMELESADIE